MYADLYVAEYLARQRADELAHHIDLTHRRASGRRATPSDDPASGPPACPPLVPERSQGRHAARPVAAH